MAKKSKKEVAAIVSGAGMFLSLNRALVDAVESVGGTMEQLYQLATPEGCKTLEAVARLIAGAAATTTYKVADVFATRSIFYQPDGDIVRWLPAELPNLPAGKPTHLVTNEGEIFRQMAERELGVSGKSDQEMMKLLVEKGKTFSLKQIEEAVACHAAGNKSFGLLDDGKANLFFVEGEDAAVFVVYVYLHPDGWGVLVYRFDGSLRWHAGRCVFFRN